MQMTNHVHDRLNGSAGFECRIKPIHGDEYNGFMRGCQIHGATDLCGSDACSGEFGNVGFLRRCTGNAAVVLT